MLNHTLCWWVAGVFGEIKMPYISLRPFMDSQEEFGRYTAINNGETSVYNKYLVYDEKMNQVVARMFRLYVLKEEKKTQEQILRYRPNYRTPLNPLSTESKFLVLERALSEEKLKTLSVEQREEERLRLDYICFHSQHELRDDLKEYTLNTMIMFRPNSDTGISFLTQAFEQTSFRDKVEAVVTCYTRMVQRIKEVKQWE